MVFFLKDQKSIIANRETNSWGIYCYTDNNCTKLSDLIRDTNYDYYKASASLSLTNDTLIPL